MSSVNSSWVPVRVKAHLRHTTQKLGQLQDKKDSLAQITRRDISTLLQQGNVGLARVKVQNLIKEDAATDLLEILEMQCGLLIEHFNELEAGVLQLGPTTIEATSSIIYAAPYTESRELQSVREILISRLGPDFTQSAINNSDHYVSRRVLRALKPVASAAALDAYLVNIASSYGVNWVPDLTMDQKINILSGMLDTSDPVQDIDLARLHTICSSGLPNQPPSLRPRIWKLLLRTLPVDKSKWVLEAQKQRESYYSLVDHFLGPYAHSAPAATPLSRADQHLLELSDSLTRVPPVLFTDLEDGPEMSTTCPLHKVPSSTSYIDVADALDQRLTIIQKATTNTNDAIQGTPEIRLEVEEEDPHDNVPLGTIPRNTPSPSAPASSKTLLHSHKFQFSGAHPGHISALLRLLFIHYATNPAIRSPYIASLLVPLYKTLNHEAEPTELAHAEADCFWLFEALLGEVAELEDEESAEMWMQKLSQRIAWADAELAADLQEKNLDPALPHYSHRWLASMLTNTLPLHDTLMIWDALFAQPFRSRDRNPKLEFLLDVCAALMIRARTQVLRLGRFKPKSPSLWNDEMGTIAPHVAQMQDGGDAFMEGMTLFSAYPIERAGGVERILQIANDLSKQRVNADQAPKTQASSLSAILKKTMWGTNGSNGINGHSSSGSKSGIEFLQTHLRRPSDDGDETETPGFASRLRTAVWKGISNQAAMEPPVSPLSPLTPLDAQETEVTQRHELQSPDESGLGSHPHQSSSSIWDYAAKLKDSDMAARLSKASTNLTVKAIGAWRQDSDTSSTASETAGTKGMVETAPQRLRVPDVNWHQGHDQDSSYEPPPRPAYFRPPRDSWLPSPRSTSPQAACIDSPESVTSGLSVSDTISEASKRLQMSLSSLPGLHTQAQEPAPPKAAPRPLLLNSTSLLTSPQAPITPDSGTRDKQWNEVLRRKVQMARQRESQSSVSSFSPIAHRSRQIEDGDSDASLSRVVPLNRARISPRAPTFRTSRYRDSSISSRSDVELLSPPDSSVLKSMTLPSIHTSAGGASLLSPNRASGSSDGGGSMKSWEHVTRIESPITSVPSPLENIPDDGVQQDAYVQVLSTSDTGTRPSLRINPTTTSRVQYADTNSDSSASPVITRTPTHLSRAKRYQNKPTNLRFRDPARSRSGSGHDTVNNSLAPEQTLGLDLAVTPKAAEFPRSPSSTEGRSPQRSPLRSPRRTRKISAESRTNKDGQTLRRKTSSDHRRTESAAHEGDDEGYDDLLSAYESEEGHTTSD